MRPRAPPAPPALPAAGSETQTPTSAFTCGVCHTPIIDETWQSCRECRNTPSNVDFHKRCISQGRQQHQQAFPGHGFQQVAHETAEDEPFAGPVQPATQSQEVSVKQEATNEYRRNERIDSTIPEEPQRKHPLTHDSSIKDEPDAIGPPRKARKSTKDSLPPPAKPQTKSKTKPKPKQVPDESLIQTRRKMNRRPVTREDTPKPTKKKAQSESKTPQARYKQDNLLEDIAKGTPNGTAKTIVPEVVSREAFATKWLFQFHCYLRNWTDDADPTFTSNGYQMLRDFEADARLNEFKTSHFLGFKEEDEGEDFFFTVSDIDVLHNPKNRSRRYSNPFKAAVAATVLNKESIRMWRDVAHNGGLVRGQNVGMIGVSRMQEIAKLLERVTAQV